jgi:uncharacterized protein (TIGR03435 family)
MEEFAGVMQAHLDRPVVDQTGLKGRFDFQLQWTPDETPFASSGRPGEPPKPPERADSLPDLFTAIQQQLGLKLESTKAQVDVLILPPQNVSLSKAVLMRKGGEDDEVKAGTLHA